MIGGAAKVRRANSGVDSEAVVGPDPPTGRNHVKLLGKRMNLRQLAFFFVTILVSADELPRHADYPVRVTTLVSLAKPKVSKEDEDVRKFSDLVVFDNRKMPNFADRFTFLDSNQGSGFVDSFLIDGISGRIYAGLSWYGGFDVECRRDSRLLIIKHGDGLYGEERPFYADCYLLKGTTFVFLGRWKTTFGKAETEKPIDWQIEVTLDPFPRTLIPK